MNKLKSQKGLTLVELLVSIVLISVIVTFTTSMIINTINNYNRIKANAILRDEADLIVSQLTKIFYTTKDSETTYIGDVTTGDYYIQKTTDASNLTGFKDGKLYIKDVTYSPSNSKIAISFNESKISETSNSNFQRIYTIQLTLRNLQNNMTKTFVAEVRSINDSVKVVQ